MIICTIIGIKWGGGVNAVDVGVFCHCLAFVKKREHITDFFFLREAVIATRGHEEVFLLWKNFWT